MHSNNNNNSSNSNSAYKTQCNNWQSNDSAVTAALLQQHQQQQHVQQLLQQQQMQQHQQQEQHHQQARITSWICDTNRTHHSLLHNNTNNSIDNCAQQQQRQQQHQQSQHSQQLTTSYMQQQQQQQQAYTNYPHSSTTPHPHPHHQQPPQNQQQITMCNTPVTAASVNNCYYASRMQQQSPQHIHQQLPIQAPQQQQQQQQQQVRQQHSPQLQVATPMRSPYPPAAATPHSHPHSPSPLPSPQPTSRTFQQHLAIAAAAAAARSVSQQHHQIQHQQQHQQQHQRLVSMDGIQSGVPTLTTSTLTPTTLRSIEETFIQLTTDLSNPPYQAGFIPPSVSSIQNSTSPVFTGAIQSYNDVDTDDSQASWANSQLNEENSMATTDTSSAATDSTSFPNGVNGISNASLATSNTSSKNDFTLLHRAIEAEAGKHAGSLLLTTSPNSSNVHTSNSAPAPTRRNQGGRRPAKATNISPEEEEKRRIRRERNKLAAARCRKRRVDQTNELQTEVDRLESIRETMQKEVEVLKVSRNRLTFLLEAHRPTCQKIRQDLLSVHTYDGLIAPANSNSNDSNSNIIGVDTTLSSVGRSGSPLDLKPIILDVTPYIKNEPMDGALDSNSSLDHDGPPSPKRMLLSDNNPMIQPPLPNVATLSASLAAASASLNTPIVTTAPVSFASFVAGTSIANNIAGGSAFTGTLIAPHRPLLCGSKQRPNSLPTNPRNQAQNLALNTERPPTDINGVAIQTPSTGMFNFDSLMDGGTGLTPVSGPLVPTCSSQNKHPLEMQTPTSEPSKLVSL